MVLGVGIRIEAHLGGFAVRVEDHAERGFGVVGRGDGLGEEVAEAVVGGVKVGCWVPEVDDGDGDGFGFG